MNIYNPAIYLFCSHIDIVDHWLFMRALETEKESNFLRVFGIVQRVHYNIMPIRFSTFPMRHRFNTDYWNIDFYDTIEDALADHFTQLI